ncbi:hypothetical protein B0H13DRAFT_1912070 [Mycena leptocephala]|nr:hypothetical protein B0H13DRAFT_1912070 [Mycena leptocephala]
MATHRLSTLPLDDLDDDIADRIMTFFFYICHPILVSKAFCESITRAVAYNIAGPALPPALHVLRYLYYNEDGSVTDTDDPHHDGCGLPGRTSCDCYHGRIETKIAGELKIVENLGRIWGISTVWRASFVSNTHVLTVCSPIRHKDRTSGTSVLTGVVVLPARDVPDHAVLQPALWGSLYAIVRFLRFILDPVCTWTENRERCGHPTVDGTAWRTACLGVPRIRPDARFGLYENDEENLLYAGYFSLPFENIWTMRKMKAVKDEGPRRGGFSITLSARMTPLRNPLSHAERRRARAVGERVFHARVDRWGGWEKDLSDSRPFLSRFMEDHLWKWYLEERSERRVVAAGELLVHKQSHASAKTEHPLVRLLFPNSINPLASVCTHPGRSLKRGIGL